MLPPNTIGTIRHNAWKIAGAAGLLLATAACSQQNVLECPAPQVGSKDVIVETPEQIRTLSQTLSGQHDLGNGINMVIAQLRKKYPKAGNAEIENYLMTAYCPVIASRAESRTVAKQQMESFRDLVGDRLYGDTK